MHHMHGIPSSQLPSLSPVPSCLRSLGRQSSTTSLSDISILILTHSILSLELPHGKVSRILRHFSIEALAAGVACLARDMDDSTSNHHLLRFSPLQLCLQPPHYLDHLDPPPQPANIALTVDW
ncbi:hypothetical protein PV10_02994 [Exophiala mesophila]|uniref:Uncharacterized protein n=1 Tax=Exophiala mesophila TaxID=212818 RepID=A0A0D1ZMY0_EXOME|nr:uncharacterized protein PV10_02994 [Exophiala mesophila]KIV95324.1 hypothetical protein PV10_02994 [Exophiala mesophila]